LALVTAVLSSLVLLAVYRREANPS